MGKKEQQIYERTCPFDKEFCAILGKSINRENVTEICENCPRYLIFKVFDEIELRDKIKKITKVLILFFLLSGCAVTQHTERKLIKTKAYCGKLVNIKYDDKISTIQTTMLIFTVKGIPDIKKGTYCYIRRIPCYADVTKQIQEKLEPKYFSWNNSVEYRVKGNIPYKLFK